jgi:pimeloyl-ACP methyl ester carboxylesterase
MTPQMFKSRAGTVTMPKIKTSDGVNLYYEEAGAGTPVVFVHEFAGDYRT